MAGSRSCAIQLNIDDLEELAEFFSTAAKALRDSYKLYQTVLSRPYPGRYRFEEMDKATSGNVGFIITVAPSQFTNQWILRQKVQARLYVVLTPRIARESAHSIKKATSGDANGFTLFNFVPLAVEVPRPGQFLKTQKPWMKLGTPNTIYC